MSEIFVYVNVTDKAEAERIAERLLDAGLVSCANIMSPHHAIYQWNGENRSEPETSMILKSVEKNYKKIEELLIQLHSYDCPPICYWKLDGGYAPFLSCIRESSGSTT